MSKLILICVVACLALSSAAPVLEDAEDAWNSYVQTYGKTYDSDEEKDLRRAQFVVNYAKINEHNSGYQKGDLTYTVGINQFSDMSPEEFLNKYTGLQFPAPTPENDQSTINSSTIEFSANPILSAAPANFDWRTASPKVLTAIKNQGQCGSCWAFATVATVEGAYNKKKGSVVGNFSEQILVDCDTVDYGCNGGWPTNAFNWFKTNGEATESAYPYTAKKGTCKTSVTRTKNPFTLYSLTNVPDATVRNNVYTYGPLTTTIDGTPLQSYTGGILNVQCTQINHAVNIVGYVTTGTGAPYYILRNSWGTSWGENGYFRVSANNPCFIKNYNWHIAI